MNRNYFSLLLLLSIFFIACSISKDTTLDQSYQFPKDWIGNYSGSLEIWNAERNLIQSCPMKLRIASTDTIGKYTWYSEMVYNGNTIVKNYNLVTHDSLPSNHFLMDENNGIYLDRVLIDDGFYDYFEVNGLGLYGITRRVKEGISFEIASFLRQSVQYSEYEGTEFKVDSVASYKVVNTQKALLYQEK